MKQIPLTQGQVATVDDVDFERFGHLKWHAHWDPKTKTYYAKRKGERYGGKQNTIALHREILGLTDPRVKGDHRNHNGLDNRRRNLRASTHAQNMANRNGPTINSTSGIRGVTWEDGRARWRAQIHANGKQINLGRFKDKFQAAAAYLNANRQHFGRFGGKL